MHELCINLAVQCFCLTCSNVCSAVADITDQPSLSTGFSNWAHTKGADFTSGLTSFILGAEFNRLCALLLIICYIICTKHCIL